MEPFFSSIALATVLKNDEIWVKNVEFAGKGKSLNDFIIVNIPY